MCVCVCVCECECMRLKMCVNTYIRTCSFAHVCVCARCTCVFALAFACVHVRMCVKTNSQQADFPGISAHHLGDLQDAKILRKHKIMMRIKKKTKRKILDRGKKQTDYTRGHQKG